MNSKLTTTTVAATALIAVAVKLKKKRRKKSKSVWVKPWLSRRENLGVETTLLREFRSEDCFEYEKFLRMSPDIFDELLSIVEPTIKKQDTVMRAALSPGIRLAATIRFLATGASYTELQHIFRVHRSTLGKLIPEVCDGIYKSLKEQYLKVRFYVYLFFINKLKI